MHGLQLCIEAHELGPCLGYKYKQQDTTVPVHLSL